MGMRTRIAEDNDALVGQECLHCAKPAEAGQVLFFRRAEWGEGSAAVLYLVLHADCARGLVERAPVPAEDVLFEEERKRIVETGKLWPSTSN